MILTIDAQGAAFRVPTDVDEFALVATAPDGAVGLDQRLPLDEARNQFPNTLQLNSDRELNDVRLLVTAQRLGVPVASAQTSVKFALDEIQQVTVRLLP